jgi:hypothetical protein
MERFKDVSTEEIEKRINERQQFLEKIAAFVRDIVLKIGEVKRQGGSGSCSETDWELINFEHFSFKFNTGWSDEYIVYYHPKDENIRLRVTPPELDFRVIEHKDELLAQRKKAEEERQEKLRLQTEEERKRAEVLEVAERLKL